MSLVVFILTVTLVGPAVDLSGVLRTVASRVPNPWAINLLGRAEG